MTASALQPADRFWDKILNSPEDCWLWGAYRDRDGYGQFWDGNRQVRAHRWVFDFLICTIPAGLVLDHLCRVRACVNPFHLEPVTASENLRRSYRSDIQTNCLHGHSWTTESTYTRPNGTRECRICRRSSRAASSQPRRQ
ncbi:MULTISPECIES: HNH endonuclease signature motif containing protein [Rhodococcus erythropolis group]|uniref:HNH endonuclease signature motif containing protein n=1 Tax=Rhodococcus erythropolis group TaxID=2840174 RepID=UPI0014137352